MKRVLKTLKKYSLYYICILAIFIICLFLVNTIPRDKMKNKVTESYMQIKEIKYFVKNLWKTEAIEGWTDNIMINICYSLEPSEPIDSVLLMRRAYTKDISRIIDFDDHQNPVTELSQMLNGENIIYKIHGRYWHGYTVFLKPLLLFFNYNQIKIICTIALIALALAYIILVFRKINKFIPLIIIFSLFAVGYYMAGFSLAYVPVWIIAMVESIVITVRKKMSPIEMFLIGALTSYFDLLITPMITLGIPLITYIFVKEEKVSIKELIIYIVNWGLGYIILWGSKLILAECFTKEGVMEYAKTKIVERSSAVADGEKLTYIAVLKENIQWIKYEMYITLVVSAICVILGIFTKSFKKNLWTYIILALLPFALYFVMKNHSFLHSKFTNKNLVITIMALGIMDYKIIKNTIKKWKGRNREEKTLDEKV